MNNAPERPSARKAFPSVFIRMAALVTLLPLALYPLIPILNVEVGLAQGPPTHLQRQESNTVRLDRARRLAYHTRFLRQVTKSSPRIEVVWSMEKVFPSLRYIAENGSEKDNDAAKAIGLVFSHTEDPQARELCLSALKRIGNKVAKGELFRIYHDDTVAAEWRSLSAEYLQLQTPQSSKPVRSVGSQLDITQWPRLN